MIYDKRNVGNLNKLAPNTKAQAFKWYEYCKSKGLNILIYETIRSLETQKANVAKGASKTMQSYHLVGQALDFVPVDSKGNALWALSNYMTPPMQDAIRYARSLGFVWGADWNSNGRVDDETFIDGPHLEYRFKGYGTDKVLHPANAPVKKEEPKVPNYTKTDVNFKGVSLPGINLHHENKVYVGLTDVVDLINKLTQSSVVWNGELKKVEVK